MLVLMQVYLDSVATQRYTPGPGLYLSRLLISGPPTAQQALQQHQGHQYANPCNMHLSSRNKYVCHQPTPLHRISAHSKKAQGTHAARGLIATELFELAMQAPAGNGFREDLCQH